MNKLKFFKEYGYMPHPQMMQIEITNACPLRCPQCFVSEFRQNFMDLETYRTIIDEAKSIGVSGIVLFGGEPMFHPQIMQFLEYAFEADLHVFLYTSGWGFTEQILSLFKMHISQFTILISLNGSCKEVHERSRNNFELTFGAILKLYGLNIPYIINWVSRQDNVNDLPQLVQLAYKYHALKINVVANKINSKGDIVEPLTLESLLFIKDIISKNTDLFCIENCNEILNNIIYGANKNEFSGCAAGVYNCSITCDLFFVPCMHLMFKEKFGSIMEYWNNSSVLLNLRNSKKRKDCQGCIYASNCNFCIALSNVTYKDFRASIPNCIIRRNDYV